MEQVTDDLVQVNEVIDLKTVKEEMIMRYQLILNQNIGEQT